MRGCLHPTVCLLQPGPLRWSLHPRPEPIPARHPHLTALPTSPGPPASSYASQHTPSTQGRHSFCSHFPPVLKSPSSARPSPMAPSAETPGTVSTTACYSDCWASLHLVIICVPSLPPPSFGKVGKGYITTTCILGAPGPREDSTNV